jgi:hypothetical protein
MKVICRPKDLSEQEYIPSRGASQPLARIIQGPRREVTHLPALAMKTGNTVTVNLIPVPVELS